VSSSKYLQCICLATAIGLAGCKSWNKPPPTSAPAPEETWTTTPIRMSPQEPMPVKEGGIPLVYLLESPSMVRVVDATAKQDLLTLPMPGKTIIAITEGGVSVGGATMKLGPLPSDHRYQIFLQSNETNVIRSGSIRPGKINQQQPATMPAP